MKINIDVWAMDDDANFKSYGKTEIQLHIPDYMGIVQLGNTVELAVQRAIILHNAKLAELKAEQEQAAPERELGQDEFASAGNQ